MEVYIIKVLKKILIFLKYVLEYKLNRGYFIMSRIRAIKPDFWKSEQVYRCSRDARLFFIGLWNFAQDTGVIKMNFAKLKLEIFPMDVDILYSDIIKFVEELLLNELIVCFKRRDEDWIYIPSWKKHQRMDYKTKCEHEPDEKELCIIDFKSYYSKFPVREEREEIYFLKEDIIYNIPSMTSSSKALSLNTNNLHIKHELNMSVLNIFNYWKEIMFINKAVLGEKRKIRIKNALKNYTEDEIKLAIVGCSKTPHNMGENSQGKKFIDIELILRNESNIERFIQNSQEDKGFWKDFINKRS